MICNDLFNLSPLIVGKNNIWKKFCAASVKSSSRNQTENIFAFVLTDLNYKYKSPSARLLHVLSDSFSLRPCHRFLADMNI